MGNSIYSANGTPPELWRINILFGNIIVAVLSFSAIVAFIFLLKGALSYITSAGNADKASSAKNTITYAILGLVFISVAYLILTILSTLTGVEALKTFNIYKNN